MRLLLTLIFILTVFNAASGQIINDTTYKSQSQTYTYAYITIEGKGFGRKLKVDVDLGDTPEKIKEGKDYSDTLTNKKSYAAVLNYMAKNKYELVGSRDNAFSFQGTGGTYGIIFIMRKKDD